MPTYQYICTECGEPLEAVQSFSDAPLTICPLCGGRLRKVFSAVGVVFKGSGFYRTDSRAPVPSSGAAAKDSGSKDGGSKDGASKDGGGKEGASKDGGSKDSGSAGEGGKKPKDAPSTSGSNRSRSGGSSDARSGGGSTPTGAAVAS